MSETVRLNLTPHWTMRHFELSPIADYVKVQTLSPIAISTDNFSVGELSEKTLVSQDSGKKTGKKNPSL